MEAGLRRFRQLQQRLCPQAHQTFAKRLEYSYTHEVRSRVSAPSDWSESSGDAPREDRPSPNEGHAARPAGTSSRKRPLDNSDHQISDSTLPNAKRTKSIPEAIHHKDKTKSCWLLTQANLESYQKSLSTTNSMQYSSGYRRGRHYGVVADGIRSSSGVHRKHTAMTLFQHSETRYKNSQYLLSTRLPPI